MRHCVGITYDCFGKHFLSTSQLFICAKKPKKTPTLIEALA